MTSNEFGKVYKITSFGESHGEAVGGIIQGFPPKFDVDLSKIQDELNKRRPGKGKFSSPRNEKDKLKILSGIYNGKTTAAPIGFVVENTNQKPKDYNKLEDIYRPSHADYTYEKKYGIRDHRGGGRSSARETIARIVAGAFAKQFLDNQGIEFITYTKSIGGIESKIDFNKISKELIYKSELKTPDKNSEKKMLNLLDKIKTDGDTIGGTVECIIKGMPVGLGEPVFDKLHARLAYAMMGINAVKAFEYGLGFMASEIPGSEQNDEFELKAGEIRTKTNNSGGIQGGISNGELINFKVGFKAISSIAKKQSTVNKKGERKELEIEGRHDICIVPRAVPIVEAMAAISIMDFYLINGLYGG